MDTQAHVDAIFERPAEQGRSLAMVMVHRGEVVAERYGTRPANDFQPAEEIGPDSTLISWSMAKSITHAAVGVLVVDGAMPNGLYGDDSTNFPGSASGHIRNTSLFPVGATNLMSPSLNFTLATSSSTAFNTLNMAYLREQVAWQKGG